MARRKISIDEKIESAKETVSRTKKKYDAAVDELEKLMKKKKEMQNSELLDAFSRSGRSYDEILTFLDVK